MGKYFSDLLMKNMRCAQITFWCIASLVAFSLLMATIGDMLCGNIVIFMVYFDVDLNMPSLKVVGGVFQFF